jgi:hypothetical protein
MVLLIPSQAWGTDGTGERLSFTTNTEWTNNHPRDFQLRQDFIRHFITLNAIDGAARAGKTILEIGTGAGLFIYVLKQMVPQLRADQITGIDECMPLTIRGRINISAPDAAVTATLFTPGEARNIIQECDMSKAVDLDRLRAARFPCGVNIIVAINVLHLFTEPSQVELLRDWAGRLWNRAPGNKIVVNVLPQQGPTIYGACFATGPLPNGPFTEYQDFKIALATPQDAANTSTGARHLVTLGTSLSLNTRVSAFPDVQRVQMYAMTNPQLVVPYLQTRPHAVNAMGYIDLRVQGENAKRDFITTFVDLHVSGLIRGGVLNGPNVISVTEHMSTLVVFSA